MIWTLPGSLIVATLQPCGLSPGQHATAVGSDTTKPRDLASSSPQKRLVLQDSGSSSCPIRGTPVGFDDDHEGPSRSLAHDTSAPQTMVTAAIFFGLRSALFHTGLPPSRLCTLLYGSCCSCDWGTHTAATHQEVLGAMKQVRAKQSRHGKEDEMRHGTT